MGTTMVRALRYRITCLMVPIRQLFRETTSAPTLPVQPQYRITTELHFRLAVHQATKSVELLRVRETSFRGIVILEFRLLLINQPTIWSRGILLEPMRRAPGHWETAILSCSTATGYISARPQPRIGSAGTPRARAMGF